MKQNMGLIDRIIRAIIAIVIGILIYFKLITGILAIILGILAAVFLLTSLLAWCPLYLPFKITTKKK